MQIGELKRFLQDHLSDGLVLIIGSGLSAQQGIATMGELAGHLQAHPPNATNPDIKEQWYEVSELLRQGKDLETALNAIEIAASLEEHIVRLTAELIEQQESPIIQGAIGGHIKLPLGRLFRHLFATAPCIPVITTNYDRLIELAADITDVYVDSMFFGQIVSRFDPPMSREGLGYAAHTRKRDDIQRKYRKHVRLFKPHGSIDWYNHNDSPVRCGVSVDLPRLMITPGKAKYMRGYEQPFDLHRNAANEAVDKAARFLILGFGFNDQQLETHLRPRIKAGRPCVIMTKALTPNAIEVIKSSSSVVGLSHGEESGRAGTVLMTQSVKEFYPDASFWNLDSFLNEVLK